MYLDGRLISYLLRIEYFVISLIQVPFLLLLTQKGFKVQIMEWAGITQ